MRALWPTPLHRPHRRYAPWGLCISIQICSSAAVFWIIFCPSCTDRTLASWIRFLCLFFLCFFITFTACSSFTSLRSRTAVYMTVAAPLIRWSIASLIYVRDIASWAVIRPLIRSVWDCNSFRFNGVFDYQGLGSLATGGGGGVWSLMSRLDMTCSGSYRTRPAPQKPPQMFSLVNVAFQASLNASRNSSFMMWLM